MIYIEYEDKNGHTQNITVSQGEVVDKIIELTTKENAVVLKATVTKGVTL